MTCTTPLRRLLLPVAALALLAAPALAGGPAPMGNQFTYQGDLAFQGSPVNDVCDVSFSLFDVPTGGLVLGPRQQVTVTVVDGRFTAEVPGWDPALFDGTPRWLEVSVRCPAGSGGFTVLDPRQRLTASPYSLVASSVKGGPVETDTLSLGFGGLDCVACVGPGDVGDEAVTLGSLVPNSVDGSKIVDGSVGSDDLADGAIASEDLGAGIVHRDHLDASDGPYFAKAQIQRIEQSETVDAGNSRFVIAECADANDLPLGSGCFTAQVNPIHVRSFRHENWTDDAAPARLECIFQNTATVSTVTVSAEIYCLSVPGP